MDRDFSGRGPRTSRLGILSPVWAPYPRDAHGALLHLRASGLEVASTASLRLKSGVADLEADPTP